jgi:hypothetical protein
LRAGGGHRIRKGLFVRGIRRGWIGIDEVERALPPGLLTPAERWLLYFSLREAEVELRDEAGRVVDMEDLLPRPAP